MKKKRNSGRSPSLMDFPKIYRIMRLIFLLLFGALIQVSASSYAQTKKISVSGKNLSFQEVLEIIEGQSEFSFFYNVNQPGMEKRFDLNIKNQTLNKLMDLLLKDSELTYSINDRLVIIHKEDEIKLVESIVQQKSVSGKVTDENGEPLPGVTVLVKGTTTGTVTNVDGEYSLTDLPVDAILQFSFVGMRTQEVEVGDQSSINIIMVADAIGIEEVVAVGYGTMRKSDLAGSVVSVSAKNVNHKPVSNLASALQGQVAGVNITQRQGIPGEAAQIRIRGANSLSAGVNDPLYVIDGMILTSLGTSFDFSDVASVQILKDASSTAIYGSRGANGVVIITTKRGATGKPKVGFSSYFGMQNLIKRLDFLEADDFKELYRTAKENASLNTSIEEDVLNSTANTDWVDEVYRAALIQNYSAYVAGGNDASKYYTSIGYFDQQGIIKNTDFSRLSFRLNADWKISDVLKISNSANINYSLRNGTSNYEGISNGVAWGRPTQPVKDKDGKYTKIALPFERSNPRALVDLRVDEHNGLRFVDNLALDFNLTKGLSAKINFGTEVNTGTDGSYIPKSILESSYLGEANKSTIKNISWINENTVNYNTTIAKSHKINALGGVTFQKSVSDGIDGQGLGYTVDNFIYHNLGAGEEQFINSSYLDNSIMSYLARLNYDYKGRYLVTFSGRYDGSSRLSEGNKWAFFPSAALAWRLTEEAFLKNNSVLSNLKIRASWGKTGSQAVASYSSLARLETTNVYFDGVSSSPGYIPQSVANHNLGWENTKQLDIGVDIGLFNGRIQCIADYYDKITSDLLFNRLVPPSSGYTSSIQNIGKIENKGFEFSLITQNVKGLFNWTSNFNISANRAKVLDLGKNPQGDDIEMIKVGGSFFYVIKGEVPFSPYGYVVDHLDFETNEYVHKDLNENGVIDVDDQRVIGNVEPKFILGFSNMMDYKNFDLLVLFQGSVGNDLFVDAMSHMMTLDGNNNTLQSVYDNAGIKYRIPNADPAHGRLDDNIIYDGTYIRLKEMSLGYNLPISLISRGGLSKVRIYITGTNLLTFDNDYPWYDPETSSGSDVVVGWDRGGYPSNKSVVAGVQVEF